MSRAIGQATCYRAGGIVSGIAGINIGHDYHHIANELGLLAFDVGKSNDTIDSDLAFISKEDVHALDGFYYDNAENREVEARISNGCVNLSGTAIAHDKFLEEIMVNRYEPIMRFNDYSIKQTIKTFKESI